MLRRNLNSESVVRRLIAEMLQIQADIDEKDEAIMDELERIRPYAREIPEAEKTKMMKAYKRNELISEAISTEIDALQEVLDKIKKQND